ncbi:MAG: bifunctional metallophosphatase/5'-nucleotidase [Marivita sp.]|uniref:bifunctional metallophosphatase/5'-nucleotidase n=1 Tax=Marivita sp. TaxID=2003365 RepID=UPI003EF5B8E2
MSYRLLTSAAALALSAGVAQADYTLHIVHINDLHSRIEPISRFNSTCSAEDNAAGECFGGVARVKTMIDQLRTELEGENFLVVDAGDQFQGSLFFMTYSGAVAAEMMNEIGFDVMSVGNHEFNLGDGALANLAETVTFPVVSGNLDVSGSTELAGKIGDTLILERGGERIGIVSALATDTKELSSPSEAVMFKDEIDSLKEDVAALQAEGVDKIIAITHVGYNLDQRIAAEVPGIDAVIGGHSHTFLSSSDPDRAGPYPTMVSQGDNLVPVVQAGAFSKYVGHLELNFDDAGVVTYAAGDTILLDASVAEDEAIVARVAELGAPIEEMKTRIVAEAADVIEGDRSVCRAVECPMGNLVADAMLDRVKDQGVEIAIQNGGGLRASIDSGEVSMGEVLTVLPFQNTLSTFQVTGAQLMAALENGVSQVEDGAGRFPQIAGMAFTATLSAEPGSRVSDVTVNGEPLDMERVYSAVSNNFVRNGGDGYAMFRGAMNAYDFGPDLADVTADYLAANAPYQPYTDGRITVNP